MLQLVDSVNYKKGVNSDPGADEAATRLSQS